MRSCDHAGSVPKVRSLATSDGVMRLHGGQGVPRGWISEDIVKLSEKRLRQYGYKSSDISHTSCYVTPA